MSTIFMHAAPANSVLSYEGLGLGHDFGPYFVQSNNGKGRLALLGLDGKVIKVRVPRNDSPIALVASDAAPADLAKFAYKS